MQKRLRSVTMLKGKLTTITDTLVDKRRKELGMVTTG